MLIISAQLSQNIPEKYLLLCRQLVGKSTIVSWNLDLRSFTSFFVGLVFHLSTQFWPLASYLEASLLYELYPTFILFVRHTLEVLLFFIRLFMLRLTPTQNSMTPCDSPSTPNMLTHASLDHPVGHQPLFLARSTGLALKMPLSFVHVSMIFSCDTSIWFFDIHHQLHICICVVYVSIYTPKNSNFKLQSHLVCLNLFLYLS